MGVKNSLLQKFVENFLANPFPPMGPVDRVLDSPGLHDWKPCTKSVSRPPPVHPRPAALTASMCTGYRASPREPPYNTCLVLTPLCKSLLRSDELCLLLEQLFSGVHSDYSLLIARLCSYTSTLVTSLYSFLYSCTEYRTPLLICIMSLTSRSGGARGADSRGATAGARAAHVPAGRGPAHVRARRVQSARGLHLLPVCPCAHFHCLPLRSRSGDSVGPLLFIAPIRI